MEAYLVDDLKDIVVNSKGQDIHGSYVVFDIETTGFSPVVNKIIEIGAVRVENGAIVDKFSTFVNPKVPIPFRIENLTGINDNMVLDAPDIETVLPKFLEFSEGAVMVAHNASFDMSFIEHNCVLQGIEREFTTADTVAMARFLLPGLNRFKLDTVAKAVGVSLENHHRAVDDAGCTAEIFVKFVKMLEERNILTLDDLNAQGKVSEEAVQASIVPCDHSGKERDGTCQSVPPRVGIPPEILQPPAEAAKERLPEIPGRSDDRICLRGGRTLPGNPAR